MAEPIRLSASGISSYDAKKAASAVEQAVNYLQQVKLDIDFKDSFSGMSMFPNTQGELRSVLSTLEKEKETIDALVTALANGTQKIEDADAGFKHDLVAETTNEKLLALLGGITSQTFHSLLGPGYWLYSIFSENELLQSIWTDTKSKLKVLGLSEEVVEILGENFGDKPEAISVLGDLSKIEKILKVIDDPTSSDTWIDAVEAFLKMCGLEDWVSSGMGGLSGSEAGLVVDLVVSDTKNLLENTAESVGLIQELINDPDATIADYLKTISYVRYNMGDGVLVEGFCDVVLDKADTIGYITGMNDYAESASGGQYSKVSDVYYDFVDLYKSNVETFGTKKAIEIYVDAFVGNIKDSVSPWVGPVVKLFAK